ncbi:MAG: UPF0182 family protein [Streptosporangiaceae bacterium]
MLATLAVLIILFFVFAGIWTDLLWYRSIGAGFSEVYWTQFRTKALLFLGGGLLMVLAVGANLIIAYRLRPAYRPLSVEQQGLERYRAAVDPHRRLIAVVMLAGLVLLTGMSAAGQTGTWLAFMNRTPFGIKDQQFHKDISFFVFTYPFLRMVLGFVFGMVILSFLVSVAVHYLYGGLRLQGPGEKASPPARAHLSVLVGLFILLKAIAYWFDTWGLAQSERGRVTGPSYTDVNAVLPAKMILAAIALICALLFFVNIWRRGMMLPGVGFGLLVLSAILIGGVYPLLVQQFQVKPNEIAKEAPYIDRNIKATRTAYGVANVQPQDYSASTSLTDTQAKKYKETVPNVRVADPAVQSPTFQQLQSLRQFYGFSDPLDLDRYKDDKGVLRDAVVAVRELTGTASNASGWVNEHLIYTHGYGFVSALGNKVDVNGQPDFTQLNMPQTCSDALATPPSPCQLKIERPQIYFGEKSPDYSVVRTTQQEFDHPDEKEVKNSYDGAGGVSLGSTFNRLLYSMKFQDRNLLLSGAITDRSRILYDRDPAKRVEKAAPWLTVDQNPYPVAAGGRLVWVVDGYTTSAGYPYSQRINFGETTADSNTERPSLGRQRGLDLNYMRNSVKATVDAYDGTVTLYTWDESDPVLKTWKKAFPDTVQDKAALQTAFKGELFPHLRYPEDLFKVQRGILSKYHVTDAQGFYGGQDYWQIPNDPTSNNVTEPPFYLTVQMPQPKDQKVAQPPGFALTSTYVAKSNNNLTAYLAADSVPTSPTYGQIRLLKLPTDKVIWGPVQVQNEFNKIVSQDLKLLANQSAQVVPGNLLTLPFGDGFLYVQSVFTQSAGSAAGNNSAKIPLLKNVLVAFGETSGYGTTFEEALNKVLAGGGTVTPPTENKPDEQKPVATSPTVQAAVDAVNQAYKDAETALKSGDLTKYAAAQKTLGDAIKRLVEAQNAAPKATPSPTPG